MAIANPFLYEKPDTVREALRLLAKHGANARPLAGGTDLIGQLVDGTARPSIVVDLKGLPGLHEIRQEKGGVQIGALATFSDLMESSVIRKKLPVMAEMTEWVASRGVRNRGTMVGNICSAVPCCDSGPILLVYRAKVLVKSAKGQRSVPISEWFTGPRRTVLKPGELVLGVRVPDPGRHGGAFVKMRRYKGEDLAQASVTALLLAGNEWRIAFGSVAPTPVPGTRIESFLSGQALTPARVEQAVALTDQETAPITDIRSTREYRAHMLRVMMRRALETAAARKAGRGPAYGTELI